MAIDDRVSTSKTILLDLWGVILDQEKAGKVMVDAYRAQASAVGTPQECVDVLVRDYQLVLRNDKSVADHKGDIVNSLQDPAERYLQHAADDRIKAEMSAAVYRDAIEVIDRANVEGYNVAVFTTRAADWVHDYLPAIGEIYDAPKGKTPERFAEVCDAELHAGRTVVSFTEDADKALLAAKKSTPAIPHLVYVNRGDNGVRAAQCGASGITYTENLSEVYHHLIGESTYGG